MATFRRRLQQLAKLYGVQTAYYDVEQQRRTASSASLLQVLRTLGAAVDKPDDLADTLRERRQELWQRPCEPVVVGWDARVPPIELRLPDTVEEGRTLVGQVTLETGEEQGWSSRLDQLPVTRVAQVEGIPYVCRTVAVPTVVPCGYHQLRLTVQGRSQRQRERTVESLLLCAPTQAYTSPHKSWGVFVPLYALHSEKSWGGGNYADLKALYDWVGAHGGNMVATLPVLATFLDQPFDPSPYAPASRLFWNEFYIAVMDIPELRHSPAARRLIESTQVQQEISALQAMDHIDYQRQMTLQRKILKVLAQDFFRTPTERSTAFHDFVAAHPALEDYARFRAVGERLEGPWSEWPQPLRDGILGEGDFADDVRRYHLYVQWIAHEQLQSLATKARQVHTSGLYLDLPLGTHPHSYEVWRERDAFALDLSSGAPPDTFFTAGQNWGFPPLHPERIRQQGYRYVTALLRHHLQCADFLRIDHVMGLHRLFCIPHGSPATEGVYIRYPAQELYALVSLESHRSSTTIIGENLGTVPSYVNAAMARHKFKRLYVLQYELPTTPGRPLRRVPAACVASLNTHDMPPFAAFWHGLDIEERGVLGLLDRQGIEAEQDKRRAAKNNLRDFLLQQQFLSGTVWDIQTALKACLSYLAASPAQVVLINVEDLWQETLPQNWPGTNDEYPNWRKKTRYPFEAWLQRAHVLELLQQTDQLRRDQTPAQKRG